MKRVQITIIPALIESQKYEVTDLVGFTLLNKGNTLVTIDDDLTLEPGQSWAIDVQNDYLICQGFDIRFGKTNLIDSPNPTINQLQVVLLKPAGEYQS